MMTTEKTVQQILAERRYAIVRGEDDAVLQADIELAHYHAKQDRALRTAYERALADRTKAIADGDWAAREEADLRIECYQERLVRLGVA